MYSVMYNVKWVLHIKTSLFYPAETDHYFHIVAYKGESPSSVSLYPPLSPI